MGVIVMRCNVCGKELSLIFHYKKLYLCQSCFEHINNIKNEPTNNDIVNNAITYFSAIFEQLKSENVNFYGVAIPLTQEFINENPDYYDAFSKQLEAKNKIYSSQTTDENQNNYEEDINEIKDTLYNIERYIRFFYIIAIIGLILGCIGLLFMFFK